MPSAARASFTRWGGLGRSVDRLPVLLLNDAEVSQQQLILDDILPPLPFLAAVGWAAAGKPALV